MKINRVFSAFAALLVKIVADNLTSGTTKILVQSNLLVNARFNLGTVEMRLFMAMLLRIGRDDHEFREMHIPLTELVARLGRRPSSKDYRQVAAVCEQLAGRVLYPAVPGTSKRAVQESTACRLVAYAKCSERRGNVQVLFSKDLNIYLLQIKENFTQTSLIEVSKLKSPHSHRIYWLLKQHSDFGKRTIRLKELKRVLDLEGQYKQFPLFKLRVLDRAQQELAETNLAFNYDLIRGKNNRVEEIHFRFKSVASERVPVAHEGTPPALPATTDWQKLLLEVGVSAPSLLVIGELIERGEIEPGYVQYVVHQQRAKSKQGKIKSLAGAVFTAITKSHSLEEYR
ncbi:hypothetical protein A0257_22765 (plasmid) [Hymenobacter psoromatis]|nr:hypothetical protein A0257_22765 [Hymenobacter psoromatis]